MEGLREVLKNKDLTQTEYQGRTFEVLIKVFKTYKKYLFPVFILFGINGYVLKNFIVFGTINIEEMVMCFFLMTSAEFALSLFQNSIISKIDGNNESDKTYLVFKAIVLSIIMSLINFFLTVSNNTFMSVIITIILALCFSYFRQIYLSQDLNLFEAIEENFKLLDGNRKRIIIPFIVVNIVFNVLSAGFIASAALIANYSTELNAELVVIIILILYKFAEALNEFYRKILASIIFLNVKYSWIF